MGNSFCKKMSIFSLNFNNFICVQDIVLRYTHNENAHLQQ